MKRGKIILTLITAISLILILIIFFNNFVTGQTDAITRCMNEPIWIDNFHAPCEEAHPLKACYVLGDFDVCHRRKNYAEAFSCLITELRRTNPQIEDDEVINLLNEAGAKQCCPYGFDAGPNSEYKKATYEEGNACCQNMNTQPEGYPGRYGADNSNKISKAFTVQEEQCCYERKPEQLADDPTQWEWGEGSKIIKKENQMCCTVDVWAPNAQINQITKAVGKNQGDNDCCVVSSTRISSTMVNGNIEAFNNNLERCCPNVGVVAFNDPKHCGGCGIWCKKLDFPPYACSLNSNGQYYCTNGRCDPINAPEECA